MRNKTRTDQVRTAVLVAVGIVLMAGVAELIVLSENGPVEVCGMKGGACVYVGQ